MKRIIMLLLVVLVASPLFALPDKEIHTYYYDSEGNQIGGQGVLCGSPYYYMWGDTSGDVYCTEDGPACEGFMEPLLCQDFGMGDISGCPGFCYSEGFILEHDLGLIGCY